MPLISGDVALSEFRAGLTGRRGLELVQDHGGCVLGQLPVGVGKSVWLDAITTEAATSGEYDLVVVLCPTRRLIEERHPLRHPPSGIRVVNLRPRPAERCGRKRDAAWKKYEAANLGALGRVEICGSCPHARGCYWPRQYGKNLKDARIVYAAQAHLDRSPGFLASLRAWAGASRTLTLLDEVNFMGTPFEKTIASHDLDRFLDVLRHVGPRCDKPAWKHQRWLNLVSMLRDASTVDLQADDWRMPYTHAQWAVIVQSVGVERHGDAFVFPGYDLLQFGFSPIETRRRADNGDIQFGVRPYIGDCMIFSGSADLDFTRFRLGKDVASPFADHRFVHPDTRWYNLASPIGSRKYFVRHAPQVLDFFAQLVVRRIVEGKRVLLIAKKCFTKLCAEGIAERFAELGADLRIVPDGWSEELLADRKVVPLINYGMIGTNLFENFDAVYCLTGYYVNEHVVNQCLQDITRRDLRLPIKVETTGIPRRRRASLAKIEHRYYDLANLVQPALSFQEAHVVLQAVGRVRPFTRPREVITFHMGELPGVSYDTEFTALSEARRFFEIASGREQRRAVLAAQIATLRGAGKTQAETADILSITDRTVRNYERKEYRKESILE